MLDAGPGVSSRRMSGLNPRLISGTPAGVRVGCSTATRAAGAAQSVVIFAPRDECSRLNCNVTYRSCCFGKCRTWNYPIDRLDRLELRSRTTFKPLKGWSGFKRKSTPARSEPDLLQLVMIDSQNAWVCSIDELTESEARWMGDVVLRARPEWFGAPRQTDGG